MNDSTANSGRFRFDATTRLPAGDGLELLHSDLSGTTTLIPSQDVALLQRCQSFATLDSHAARLCQEQGLGVLHIEAVRQKLATMAETGLLLSEARLLERIINDTGHDTSAAISYLGIPTRNRPLQLAQCLESYAQCMRATGREITIVVADQSDAAHVDANRSVLQKLKSEFGCTIQHIDGSTTDDIVRRLSVQSGVDSSIVQYALGPRVSGGFCGGANRNLLLLNSVGSLILQVDDDSKCRAIPPPEVSAQLLFSSDHDASDCWFSSKDEVAALCDDANADMFALHEKYLGKTLARCMQQHDNQVNIDSANSSFFRRLASSNNKVSITNTGVAGESGRREGQPFIFTAGEKRERLVASKEKYDGAQQEQQIMRGARGTTINDGTLCFGFNLGIDNRTLVPPFMPFMRGEDTVFSTLFRVIWKGEYFAMLPWLAYHTGAARKVRGATIDTSDAIHLRFAELLGLMIQMYQGRSLQEETERRLTAAADWLIEIGTGPVKEFESVLQRIWWQATAANIRRLEQALKTHRGQPDYWAQDLIAHIRSYQQSLTDPSYLISADIIQLFGSNAAMERQRDMVAQFGAFLRAWPALRTAAAELRRRDSTFGRKI
ncbi:MAG TPA: hypothetical protein V6C81_21900 [Planktothrix sp.]